ncbi:uncharacterized protein DNG_09778 [Cephalotrichum gorgonifer]|uniref:Uncharacterized protein n=1 Tax=Cephalotrichum gorgonifer TaxID=2041049 RepID=A0AAE8N7U6_9PEZI|nr:uncharacterized protein DNG_09778 [Cephalotrichum gorgonifer]
MAPQGKMTPEGLVPWAVYRSRCIYLGHFHPGHQCGVCGGVFTFNERCIGLLGNPDSTSCWLSTTPFLYPDYGLTLRAVDGWSICRRPECPQCAASPEAATLHLECFEAFRQAYAPVDALDRLWRAASWRRPWRSAPAVVLPERGTIGAVEAVAAKCGLPELSRMPPEIIHMVRGYSESALFWRLVAALDLAVQFKTGPPGSLHSVALFQVAGWKRGCGSPPTSSDDLDGHRVIRLTIDSRGIKEIERLPASEPHYSSQSGGTFSAIHAHTDAAPYARIPHESLSRRAQNFVSWIYVPVTTHDKVLAIGLREPDMASVMKRHCVLLHTELAGDVSVGPWLPGSNRNYMLSNCPSTLLYDRKETAKVSVIGAFPKATPTWFCAQCITRLEQQLSISLLELNTFGHAICTLLVYCLWWSKPLDIAEPEIIPVENEDMKRIIAAMSLTSKLEANPWEPEFIGKHELNFVVEWNPKRNQGRTITRDYYERSDTSC